MEKRGRGRPTKYKERTVNAICARIIMGESLVHICRRKGYPARRTVMYWLASKPEFLHKYTHAKELQQEYYSEEILDIADDGSNDWYMKTNKDGSETPLVDHENINRSRLRIDTRKWLMERLAVKKYGDRKHVEHSGKVEVSDMTESDLDRKIAKLLNKPE